LFGHEGILAALAEFATMRKTMTKALNLDLKKLKARAFDRAECAKKVLQHKEETHQRH
jgi:hypothetical protein